MKSAIINFKKFSFLLTQLVIRDFKVKYKRSFLGVIWSLLYPLLMMFVMALVFSKVFKFSVGPDVNYLVYLFIGLIIFNYFSEASTYAMGSIVNNFTLLTKVYIPKYIFPLSKCLFIGINFVLTLIPLYIIIFVTGGYVSFSHFILPYSFICLFIFTFGVGILMSAVSVFFRDMFYIYGILTTILTYFTPIMYDISMLPEQIIPILKFNPLYQYINFARTIILYDNIPSLNSFLFCGVSAIAMLVIGILVFKKTQSKFIYHI